MIELDVNLSYLTKHFEIAPSRLDKYKNKSITEVIQEEVKLGNLGALNYASAISDPDEVLELFRLASFSNRFMIIKNLDDDSLNKVLEKLPSEDLIRGLNYFQPEALIQLLNELPPEELLKVVFQKFGLEHIVLLMETEELNDFLNSTKINKEQMMACFEGFNKEFLDKIMLETMNMNTKNKTKEEILEQINSLDNKQFKKFINDMDKLQKQIMVFELCKNDPKLIREINPEALSRPLAQLNKAEILQCMNVLDPEFLIPMVQELPPELIQVVASQVDPADFAELLVKEFPEILQQIKL